MSDGAHVEIVEPDHTPGDAVLPTVVRVNGVDVGALAKPPKVEAGSSDEYATVTLVLIPSRLEIKGDDTPTDRKPIGFGT
ncbi:hypothetical protein ACFRNT_11630 [Streptomyces sp. NPDC056697]|uniref:hypothetical protein n=1 Tax=Streptomyces sp. NPDC056697 TaxID=3345915 RepID=UPI0036BD889B